MGYFNTFGRWVSDDELLHYGVGHLDGGHSGRYEWNTGMRPRQDADDPGSSEAGRNKLKKIQAKELAASNKKHDKLINKLDKKIAKRTKKLENASDRKRKRLEKSISEYSQLRARRKIMKALESDAIKKMTLKDFKSEKRKIAARKFDYALSIVADAFVTKDRSDKYRIAVDANNIRINEIRRNTKGYKTASRLSKYSNQKDIERYAKKEGIKVKDVNELMPHRGGDYASALNRYTKKKYK